MALYSVVRLAIGVVDVTPGIVFVNSNDALASVVAAGYLNKQNLEGTQINPNDMLLVAYSTNSVAWFKPSIAFGTNVITLSLASPIETGAFTVGNLVKSGANGTLVDAACALHAGVTAAYGGGGTSNTFVTTNMTSASIVTAVILTSTNAVSIAKAVPGTNQLAVTFSADPGAGTTLNWISVTPAA